MAILGLIEHEGTKTRSSSALCLFLRFFVSSCSVKICQLIMNGCLMTFLGLCGAELLEKTGEISSKTGEIFSWEAEIGQQKE